MVQDGGTYSKLTTLERVKYHYLPKLYKVCPEIEHEFNDFVVIGVQGHFKWTGNR